MPLIRKTPSQPPVPASPDTQAAIAALRDGTIQARWAAARLLATFPAAAPALGEALGRETDRGVREAIFTALARIDTVESVEAVLPYLRCDDAGLRAGALDALKAMPGAVQSHLALLLEDADPDVRIFACELAREAPSEEASRLLTAILDRDPAVNVCAAAIETLAEIGSTDAVASLTRCAGRFPGQPFLDFAAKAACTRIGSQSPRRHG